jgi:hypothetical protein
MNRLRTLIFALAMTLGIVFSLGGSSTVQADSTKIHPPQVHHSQQHHHSHHRVYFVFYRTSPDAAWVCYGGYYSRNHAHQAVNYFRAMGYDSFLRKT